RCGRRRKLRMMCSVVLPEEALVQAAHRLISHPRKKTVRAGFLGRQEAADHEFARAHEHAIRGIGACEAQLIPSDACGRNLRDRVEVGQETTQGILACLRHVTPADQEDHDAFENPIVQCVELVFVELADQTSAHHRPGRDSASDVDPTSDSGQFVRLTAVVTVETAFYLRSDALNENLGHEVMESIEALRGEAIFAGVVNRSECVGHHHIHIANDDGAISHAIAVLSATAHPFALFGSSNQYSSSKGTSSSSTTDCNQAEAASPSDWASEGMDK